MSGRGVGGDLLPVAAESRHLPYPQTDSESGAVSEAPGVVALTYLDPWATATVDIDRINEDKQVNRFG